MIPVGRAEMSRFGAHGIQGDGVKRPHVVKQHLDPAGLAGPDIPARRDEGRSRVNIELPGLFLDQAWSRPLKARVTNESVDYSVIMPDDPFKVPVAGKGRQRRQTPLGHLTIDQGSGATAPHVRQC